MKNTITALSITIASVFAFPAQAELIQHTDQIAEVQFTGSSYELGKHLGDVAKDQILDSIDRFNNMLGVMLPGLNVISLSKSFDSQNIYGKLQKSSPDAAAYIGGLAEALNRDPNLLLAVGMSDEAILESQRNGGMGFLQSDKPAYNPSEPAKCTVMGMSDKQGKAWAQANFDYMGINYEGLIVLNHTDTDGNRRVIQTWAGLIPYGGVSKGGQALLMNTMADEGTARQNVQGEILADDATPSFYLSWEAYNIIQPKELIDIFQNHDSYTAFFAYTVVDAHQAVLNIENNFGGKVNYASLDKQAHANHSLFVDKDFVNHSFAAHSLERQKAADTFIASASIDTPKSVSQQFAEDKPLWKGRGEMMGTVTSTYFEINGTEVDMFIKTDSTHPEVHIKNY
ncbi:C45 family autoproteolytic acyltransferase/hydolase [Shewanella sp. UCD-KL12]|uniref:C45 family autoproteolytic acyltransferase/hydolase n=1 Tax=Shewanella sp. UCD-KL12 TaxID=1917163 RepID=UPI0009712BF4|nr:C45 family autoproteolytic acyltransferase/hydolase [Shewanella sp. UCD-KL12]